MPVIRPRNRSTSWEGPKEEVSINQRNNSELTSMNSPPAKQIWWRKIWNLFYSFVFISTK